MRKAHLLEATALLNRALVGLATTVGGPQTGRADADLRRAIGDMQARAAQLVSTGTIGTPLAAAFSLAVQSGSTFDGMDRLRRQLIKESPVSLAAVTITELVVRLTLVAMCLLVAEKVFESREDAEIVLGRINEAFDSAEEDAADNLETQVYQALLALHGATVRDLVARSMVLPRIIKYTFARAMPSLVIAQKLYPDDTKINDRSAEIRLENKVVHPAFAPRLGVCLSS